MDNGERPFPRWRSWVFRARRKFVRVSRWLGLGWRGWIIITLFLLVLPFSPHILRGFSTLIKVPGVMISLVSPTVPDLDKTDGRTNILLLGAAGGAHDGADLTDTIMVVSVDVESRDVVLLSLPRDLWLTELNGGSRLNAAYAIGERKRPGGGLVLAKSMVEAVTNVPIHYAIRVDFSGFERAVDHVGGLDIIVERSFDDERYPIAGRERDDCDGDPEYNCRYEHIHFDTGAQHMDGATALKFVRSRMGTNGEGTDFARTRRQQKALLAFREKVLSTSLLLQPGRIKGLYDTFGASVDTDISVNDVGKFYRLVRRLQEGRIRSYVLDDEEGDPPLLFNPSTSQYDGQWVLLPTDRSWKTIHAWIKMLLFDPDYVQPTPVATTSAR